MSSLFEFSGSAIENTRFEFQVQTQIWCALYGKDRLPSH